MWGRLLLCSLVVRSRRCVGSGVICQCRIVLFSLLPVLSCGTARRGTRDVSFGKYFRLSGARREEADGMGCFLKNLARLFREGRLQFGATCPFADEDSTVLFRVDVVSAELEGSVFG